MKKQKKNQNLIILIIAIVMVLVVYYVITLVRFFKTPANTVMIKNGELINYEEVVGYVIRDEETISTR